MRIINGHHARAERLTSTWPAMDALRIFITHARRGHAPREVQLWRDGKPVGAQRYPREDDTVTANIVISIELDQDDDESDIDDFRRRLEFLVATWDGYGYDSGRTRARVLNAMRIP